MRDWKLLSIIHTSVWSTFLLQHAALLYVPCVFYVRALCARARKTFDPYIPRSSEPTLWRKEVPERLIHRQTVKESVPFNGRKGSFPYSQKQLQTLA